MAPPTVEEVQAREEAAAKEAALSAIRRSAKPPQVLCLGDAKVENWKVFKQRWENYSLLSALDKVPRDLQVAQLENCLGDEALKAMSGFKFTTPDDQRTVKEILDEFERFVIGQVNQTLERYRFGNRSQAEGEDFSRYLSELRRLMKSCGYCQDCEPSILRDRIIIGIRDEATRDELLKVSDLTLQRCVELCEAGQAASAHKSSLRSEHVNKVTKQTAKKKTSGTCRYCGTEHKFQKELCPAWGKECTACGRKNHFEKCCKSKKKGKRKKKGSKKIHKVEGDSESSSESSDEDSAAEWVNNVKSKKSDKRDIRCRMKIEDEDVVFQVDPGATCNIITARYAKNIEPYRGGGLQMWDDTAYMPIGKCRLTIKNPKNGKKHSLKFLVCDNKLQPILGCRDSEKMGLITVNDNLFHRVAAVNCDDFKDVFNDELGSLPGEQVLRVQKDARPVVMGNRRISINLRPALQKELTRLEKKGVIEKVTEPTPWLSQLVITPKKDGSLRTCIDPLELNKVLLREHYSMPVLEEVLHELKDAKVFSKADLASGYWQVKLDEESKRLTAFQTPFGRFQYRRLPFGLCASAEIFQRKVIEALEGLPGVICIADDIVIHGRDDEEHNTRLLNFLKRCREKNIRLNKKKFEVGLKEITFMGHQISTDGLKADPEKVEAIMKMPRPEDLTELRRFLGMVNYMSKFLPSLASTMQPLNHLLKKDVPWNWSEHEEDTFQKVKKNICETPVLTFYDPAKPLQLENDACEYGLGSVLLQGGRPLAYASRSLTETERRYAQIEKEMLAAVYGLEKFHQYTYARHVDVITDHKPLEAISKKTLAKAPRRLQNLLLRAKTYDYSITYKPGKDIPTADTLSRSPIGKPRKEEVVRSVKCFPLKNNIMKSIQEATAIDEELHDLGNLIMRGWPNNRKEVPESMLQYFNCREELSITDGVIMRGERVVIPSKMRKEMKKRVHTGHMGINSCLRLAKDVMFWPRMTSDIRHYIETCGTCATFSDKQPRESIITTPIPERPWEKIAVDLFQWGGDNYLVTCDYHSNAIEVDELKNTSSSDVIKKLKAHFARNGVPITVVSDNGPQFSSTEFKTFAQGWDFQHQTISPGNSQANGAAEVAVRTVKRIMRKSKAANEDWYKGLLNYHNVPTEGLNTSPAQRHLGRRTRTLLPMNEDKLLHQAVDGRNEKKKKEDSRSKRVPDGNDLKLLDIGDTVRMQPIDGQSREWKEAVIVRPLTTRSYEVEANGRTYVRNRRHLRASKTEHSQPSKPSTTTNTTELHTLVTPADPPTNANPTPPSSPTPAAEVNIQASYTTRSGRAVKAPSRLISEK